MATGLISRLLSTLSSSQSEANPPTHAFLIRTSPRDSSLITLYAAGCPTDAPPVLFIQRTKATKGNLLLFKGLPGTSVALGDASFHYFTSTSDLRVRGQSIRLKKSELTGDLSMTCPPMGKLKWKVKKLTGSLMVLCGSNGDRLAEFKPTGKFGFGDDMLLDILVPGDEFFVELVVLSAMAARALSRAENEAAVGVMDGLGGAS